MIKIVWLVILGVVQGNTFVQNINFKKL